MTSLSSNCGDSDFLAEELASAEKALEETERRLLLARQDDEEQRQQASSSSNQYYEDEYEENVHDTSVSHLIHLEQTTNHLLLVKDVAEWVRKCDAYRTTGQDKLCQESYDCCTLAELLCRHSPSPSLSSDNHNNSNMHQQLYEQEYLPLYTYLRSELVLSFRRALNNNDAAGCQYPTKEGCSKMLQVIDDPRNADAAQSALLLNSMVSHCQWLIRLDTTHQRLMQHLKLPANNTSKGIDMIVMELCRPFVERLQYHFVDKDETRPTSSRIDRLPEWLFSYLRDHFFMEGGPWDFIVYGLVGTAAAIATTTTDNDYATTEFQDLLPVRVLNEMIRVVQWVFNERNFWRHPKIAGPASKPILLCNAVEQLLLMDQDLQGAMLSSSSDGGTTASSSSNLNRRLLSLMDIFVAGDEELLHWWLQREKETAFSTLFDESATATTAASSVALVVHPRAELFCALVTSMQIKTSLFSFSGPYWNYVAAPLCMQFVDMVHDKVLDLKQQLFNNKSLLGHGGPGNAALKSNLMEWIQLINGVHMAAQTLLDGVSGGDNERNNAMEVEDQDESGTSNQDVIRFGKSLQNLEQVLVEDFSKAFVETVIMERTKMAGYLMRCSTLLLFEEKEDWLTAESNTPHPLNVSLSFEEDITSSHDHSLSPDLRDSVRHLHRFLRVCDSAAAVHTDTDDNNDERVRQIQQIAEYAPRVMCARVLTLLSEKLMEVAMNWHDMTPDLYYYGCTVFAGDVEVLFGLASNLPPVALRLIEIVTKLMAMPSQQLGQIGQALCGLAGQPAPLSEQAFLDDDRLYTEAISMIRAKGLIYVELDDVLSVLNRRRELDAGF